MLRSSKLALLALTTVLLSGDHLYGQTTWSVDPEIPWTTAFGTIQAALDSPDVQSGDTILVAPDVYFENLDFNGKSVSITATLGASNTFLIASGDLPCIRAVSGEGLGAAFVGFTVLHLSDGDDTPLFLEMSGAVLRIEDCLVQDIDAGWTSEFASVIDSDLQIRDCTFFENQGSEFSGTDSSLDVSGCLFQDNAYWEDGNSPLMINGGTCTFEDTQFIDNWPWYSGGAMWLRGTNAQILNCTFEGNGTVDDYFGGAILIGTPWGDPSGLDGSLVEIVSCAFADNYAGTGGAIAVYGPSVVTVLDSTFEDNTVRACCPIQVGDEGVGGGIMVAAGASCLVESSLFFGNISRGPAGGNPARGGV